MEQKQSDVLALFGATGALNDPYRESIDEYGGAPGDLVTV
jgi:hypothetical protein